MAEPEERPNQQPDRPLSGEDRLTSWKDIAKYLDQSPRTVQRWEQQNGLPVYRQTGQTRGPVFAYRSELEAWWEQQKDQADALGERAERTALSSSGNGSSDSKWPWAAKAAVILRSFTAKLAVSNAPRNGAASARAGAVGTSPGFRAPVNRALVAIPALTMILAIWAPWRATPERPLIRLVVELGEDLTLGLAMGSTAISPDGKLLAYIADADDDAWPSRIYVRSLDQPDATALPGTEEANQIFFSADSQWIAFRVGRELQKVSVHGGAVVPISGLEELPNLGGIDWAADGSFVVGQGNGRPLVRIPPEGGDPEAITDPVPAGLWFTVPDVLPGGEAALIAVFQDPKDTTIEAIRFADSTRTVLVRGATHPLYLPSGHLIYLSGSTLFAIAFDAERLETRGKPMPLLNDVSVMEGGSPYADISFSEDGTLVYRAGPEVPLSATINRDRSVRMIDWVDSFGNRSPLLPEPRPFQQLSLSPDGQQMAVQVPGDPADDIAVYDIRRDVLNRISFSGVPKGWPIWTPDGRFIVYAQNRRIFWARSDGASEPQMLIKLEGSAAPRSFTPDGTRLAFHVEDDSGRDARIFTVSIQENDGQLQAGTPELFLESANDPQFSPDGRWLAYQDIDPRGLTINVRPFPIRVGDSSTQWQVSKEDGTRPHWSRNAHEILYRSAEGIMAVPYTIEGDRFTPGPPRLHTDQVASRNWLDVWDLAPDGRIAMLLPHEPAQQEAAQEPPRPHHVVFLQNFFEELRRVVP